MLSRRAILSTVPAAAVVGSVRSAAADTIDVKIDPQNMTDAQKAAHSVRFPKLDQESAQDFVTGFHRWFGRGPANPSGAAHTNAYLRSKGLDMLADTNMSYEKAWAVMMQDPIYAMRVRLQMSVQDLMWERAMHAFHSDSEKYLSAMEKTDKSGPGTLELNPDLKIPEYAKYEIHRQPGGYVGDPFAGWVYHWALTAGYYHGLYDHDELHEAVAQSHPKPADGAVRRVLDIGCGSGLTTTAYKDRFPDAEIWGIDVGAPMVRYARHYRAVQMNSAVNFAQRLAEDSKFPDNHFCLINDFLTFHEIELSVHPKVAAEMFRVMRPGGVWKHNDVASEGNPFAPPGHTVTGRAATYNVHRNHVEPWYIERDTSDFPAILRQAGFIVDLTPEPHPNGVPFARVVATKPA